MDAVLIYQEGVGPGVKEAIFFSGDSFCRWNTKLDICITEPEVKTISNGSCIGNSSSNNSSSSSSGEHTMPSKRVRERSTVTKIKTAFLGYPFEKVDAVFICPPNIGGPPAHIAFMFSNEEFCEYNLKKNILVRGPTKINQLFPGFPFPRIDGVMVHNKDFGHNAHQRCVAHFFCGQEFCYWDLRNMQQKRRQAEAATKENTEKNTKTVSKIISHWRGVRPSTKYYIYFFPITSANVNNRKYKCKFCGAVFTDRKRYAKWLFKMIYLSYDFYSIVEHVGKHTGEHPYECAVCNKVRYSLAFS